MIQKKLKKNDKVLYKGKTWNVVSVYEDNGKTMVKLNSKKNLHSSIDIIYNVPIDDLFIL